MSTSTVGFMYSASEQIEALGCQITGAVAHIDRILSAHFIDDDAMIEQISNYLRGIAGNVEQVKGSGRKIECITKNESEKTSRITGGDKEIIKKHLLQQASQKYRLLEESGYKDQRLKDMFRVLKRVVEKKPFLTEMDEALFDEIVDKICVGQDGSLTFVLKCELKLRVKW